MDDALKTRDNIYLNVETLLLLAPPIKISGYVPGSQAFDHYSIHFQLAIRCAPQSARLRLHIVCLSCNNGMLRDAKKIASKLSRSTHPCGSFIFNDVYADQEPRSEGAERRAL